MTRRAAVVALVAAVLPIIPARAAGQAACDDATTQAAMNACAARDAEEEVRRLDALLRELDAALEAGRAEVLRVMQARWEEHRDAHCAWEADAFHGGSVAPMMYSLCIADLTRKRIDELRFHVCRGSGMAGECEASLRYRAPEPVPEGRAARCHPGRCEKRRPRW